MRTSSYPYTFLFTHTNSYYTTRTWNTDSQQDLRPSRSGSGTSETPSDRKEKCVIKKRGRGSRKGGPPSCRHPCQGQRGGNVRDRKDLYYTNKETRVTFLRLPLAFIEYGIVKKNSVFSFPITWTLGTWTSGEKDHTFTPVTCPRRLVGTPGLEVVPFLNWGWVGDSSLWPWFKEGQEFDDDI